MLDYLAWLVVLPVLLITGLGYGVSRDPVGPIPQSMDPLVLADFGPDFYFGLATAPAHVEDDLNDSWLEFAKRGKVAAWSNHHKPEDRIKFWTEPETEVDLVVEAGATVLRLGVDWQRVVPEPGKVDSAALARYAEIVKMIKGRGLKVMLTLFHHSAPTWVANYGGWPEPRAIDDFVAFSKLVVDEIGDDVDYWTIFNEPHVFTILTHCAGVWPPGKEFSVFGALKCFSPFGEYAWALKNMANAHGQLYKYIHAKKTNAEVGMAHHIGYISGHGLFDLPGALYNHFMTTYYFVDLTYEQSDFIGLNYYGQEFISGTGVAILPEEEYSDAGRGIYPDGLYHLLMGYEKRYPGRRFMITENGVSDAKDVVRGAYLVQHLLAIKAAMAQGVKVEGYVFWTISDNWEWADGYCPKFGLVAVDREDGLKRTKRPSFALFQEIATTGVVTHQQAESTWETVREGVRTGLERPFCRDITAGGMTGAFGIDEPVGRKVVDKEWRYGRYEGPLLVDPVGNFMERAWKAAEPKVQELVILIKPKVQELVDLIKGYLSERKKDLQWTQEAAEAEL